MTAVSKRALSRARAALDRGNWLRAVDLLQTDLRRRPNCVDTCVELAHIYLEQGRLALAEDLVDQAFSLADVGNPDRACPLTESHRELYLLKANLRLAHGDPQGALSLYTLLLAEQAHDPNLLFHAGLAYERMAQHELSVAYLDRAIAEDPDYLPAIEIKGQILLCMGRLKEALDLYTEITVRYPDNVNAYAMLGRIYHHLERPVAAISAWERAVALAPNADDPLRMLGRAALKAGDVVQARDYLTRSLAANPANIHTHLDLAELLADLGETRAALAHWDEAERLCPNHPRLSACRERREQVASQVAHCCLPPDVSQLGRRGYAQAVARALSLCDYCSGEEPASS